MAPSGVLPLAATVVVALLLAWWPWRGSLATSTARLAVLARAAGVLALLLLLLDPGIRGSVTRRTPLVLLDNSVSMHAAGALADSAAALAASLGEVTRFGELAEGEPGAQSTLADRLPAAEALGRPIVVVTDGEITDGGLLGADVLAQVTVHTLPRRRGPDVALTDVRMPIRLPAGDTLRVEVDLLASGGWRDSVTVDVRDGDRVLLAARIGFTAADRRAAARLVGVLPPGLEGERWLEIAVRDVDDAEPADHLRWRPLRVTPSPGIVVLAVVPDWDARFLASVLAAVTDAPVRGFTQLAPGRWHRMDDLRPVGLAEVTEAARQADLLAVRGDTTAWHTLGRARLLWPALGTAGDWYLTPVGFSPLGSAFAGLDPDSLPPLPEVSPLAAGDWVAAVARQARRGAEVPVLTGTSAGGRTVRLGAQGLYRWGFRGGAAEQAWRALIAEAASWLLDAPAEDGAVASPVGAVTQRGRPVRFRATAPGLAELPIVLTAGSVVRNDTLRFDPDGQAVLPLPPGRYRYRFLDGSGGEVAVEPYADELVPGPVGLASRAAAVAPVAPRRSLRELLPFFLVAVAGFSLEWVLRRRVGLR